MQRISITNPQNVIDGTAKKYYFKLRNTGGPKGDKGDKGDTGATGPQGPQGNAATVSVGSTTTLPVGYDATVTNSGSIYNAILDFGIPQGPQGPQGAKGEKGDTGAQGETGPRGPQGEKGTNATVYIGTTTTLNPGSQATVYNSGTDSNAVLNFGIPKGEKGDTGPMPTIAQTTGQSTTEVMSQKATTDALATKQNTIDSSHKLSADLVDDTSTTNKFVTASDKTTWNAKQNALTAGDNITISGDTISTPAIAPEVVAELPATGAEGKLYLTPKNYTRSTATGNPITATVAEDAGAIESFQLDGDTFQQSYTGKNLLQFIPRSGEGMTTTYDAETGLAHVSGTNSSNDGKWSNICESVECSIPAGTYTLSTTEAQSNLDFHIRFRYTDDSTGDFNIGKNNTSKTFDMPKDAKKVYIWYGGLTPTYSSVDFTVGIQLEAGSTPTSFEPYVGGVPSPSPSYPQQIRTVTGLQTITINGTGYPLDLGSIELCKLSTYQDYIYKDGDDWKVHKATSKYIFTGDSNIDDYVFNTDTGTSVAVNLVPLKYDQAAIKIGSISSGLSWGASDKFRFTSSSGDDRLYLTSAYSIGDDMWKSNIRLYLSETRLPGYSASMTNSEKLALVTTWISDNPITAYFIPSTGDTDTTITDTTLIAQLEAIRTAALENGANTITNTATGSNLAGDMEISYYGYNPTNRYDKWLWLNINNNYEQIGE